MKLVTMLVGLAVVVQTAEMISMRREFRRAGIMSCDIARLVRTQNSAWATRIMGGLAARQTVLFGVLCVRVGVGLLLIVSLVFDYPPIVVLILLSVALLSTLMIHVATVFGKDGADQMVLIVLAGAFVAQLGLLQQSDLLVLSGLCFVGAQCVLAYFTAGVAKLRGQLWRTGRAVEEILGTRSYGHRGIRTTLVEHPRLAKGVTFGVLAFEVGFPLSLVLPEAGTIAYLSLGFAFHIGIAVAMGLNTFVWAFAASYPAVWYTAGLF